MFYEFEVSEFKNVANGELYWKNVSILSIIWTDITHAWKLFIGNGINMQKNESSNGLLSEKSSAEIKKKKK